MSAYSTANASVMARSAFRFLSASVCKTSTNFAGHRRPLLVAALITSGRFMLIGQVVADLCRRKFHIGLTLLVTE